MGQAREFVRLDGGDTTLVFACAQGRAADLLYLGARLADGEDLGALAASQARTVHESQPDAPPVPGLLPTRKGGWGGSRAAAFLKEGASVETDFVLAQWTRSAHGLTLRYEDAHHGVAIDLIWDLSPDGMVRSRIRVTNNSTDAIALDRLSSIAVPIPQRFNEMTTFSGRWAGEMRESRRPIAPEGFARRSAFGKPGFGGGNWLLLHAPFTGEVIGAHLGWSGDYDTAIECDTEGAGDGRAILQMAAAFEPGEISIKAGGDFESPQALLAVAKDRSALAARFHKAVRDSVLPPGFSASPRKVHLNSWEALGFNLSEPDLFALVDSASELGVERFVLDDGWFGGRRNDRTSLGDWFVSPDIFPNGLNPLIDHVHARGMDFGLWVEPEMVSPNSDLYRAHPDWCLTAEGQDRGTMRGQLVLDLTRSEVLDALERQIAALLATHAIAYLKWDHNRTLFPVAGKGHRQTQGFYELLARLRSAFPEVEIESCSSGGGRIDTGVLKHTQRVWPSDNNDPIERMRIIRAWSQFLPLEVLGSHVGPSPNPITGRRTAIDYRAKVAMFGHMGVEADPRAMREADRTNLAAHIALYKQWRGVLHTGDLTRIDHPDPGISGLMVAHEARSLALIAQTGFAAEFDGAPVRLGGLDPRAFYRVTLPQPWPFKAALYLANPDIWREGIVLSGQSLAATGLALPLTHPETAWLIALEKLNP